jgi:hypothetical protein
MRCVWIAFVVMLSACDDPSRQPSTELRDNLGVSISDVLGLAIGSAASHGASISAMHEQSHNSLLLLGADGRLEPVGLTPAGSGDPQALIDTPLFVLVTTSDVDHKGQHCASVLIRKSDSAMFCVPIAPASPRLNNADRVQWGSTGEVVAIDDGRGLYRLELGSEAVTLTTLPLGGAELVNFAVNAADDVLVNLRQDNGTLVRLHPRSGEPSFVTARNQSCVYPGPVGSRDFYLALGWSNETTVDRLQGRADGTYSSPERVWTQGAAVWNDCGVVYRDESRLLVRAATRLLELANPSGTPHEPHIEVKAARGGSLFNWGQDSEGRAFVTRYEPPDYGPVELLAAAPYRLGHVGVSPAGEVTFVATRLSDGMRVVGTLRGNALSVAEQPPSQPDILTLVRIR